VLALLAPLAFALFLWWFSTGLILWLDRLPRATHGWSFAAASALAIWACFAIADTANAATGANAYVAFVAALAVWGWHEMSFLMGFIAGPRTSACPQGAEGWSRFKFAAATVIHHELALAATLVALIALSWGQPNQIAALTFGLLWAMRLSAKFNLFLGAPHRSEAFLPAHMAYLASYFRDQRMNGLFPVSMAFGMAACLAFASIAFAPDATGHERVGYSLLVAMAGLALLEHAFMFVANPNDVLWRWALPRAVRASQDSPTRLASPRAAQRPNQ
jgi:putative photosynthetic complex assembly protein 2